MNEFDCIDRIRSIVGPNSDAVDLGIGDDAAIVTPPSGRLLLCTDAMVEGVHFDLKYTTAADLGHKSLACALSDIAAMNGAPSYALFSIALPKETSERFLEEFYKSATQLARAHGVEIVGGDLSSSPTGIFVDVVCAGRSERPVRRSGARPGDILVVSGHPGTSAAGLAALRKFSRDQVPRDLLEAHLHPRPRFDLLPALNSVPGLCTSLIDISDGLVSETNHLARASRIGFEIEASRIPLHAESLRLAKSFCTDPLEWALGGGEDYELLATLDSAKVLGHEGIPQGFTAIGRAVDSPAGSRADVRLLLPDGTSRPLRTSGFDHFSDS